MKRILISLFLFWPALAFGQLVNPTVIYQDTDIALHHTDVYYSPFAPPDSTDTRAGLSCIDSELRDPDGRTANSAYVYFPITHDTLLSLWQPHGIPLGPSAVWQRLFTANDKPGGAHSDITVGSTTERDTVTISKNEDVDFRATGTIKMEAGFHVMPGAFFHAYIAPTFDTTVFSDEFDSSTIDRSKWFVTNGHAWYSGPDCEFDTNLVMVADPDAHDGHALRMDMKEDTCSCMEMGFATVPDSTIHDCLGHWNHGCDEIIQTCADEHYAFSTGMIMTCPFPFASDTFPNRSAYAHAPYGKWEVREKIPAFMHHYNNYGGGQSNEWNTGETYGGNMQYLHPGLTRQFIFGPCHGRFYHDTLRCFDTAFCFTNNPNVVVINGFPYEVGLTLQIHPVIDTFMLAAATTHYEGGFPSSLTSSTDTITFYYVKQVACLSDSLPWYIDSTGTYFSGPYALDHHADSLFFGKTYQPISIGLRTKPPFYDTVLFFSCHWDHITGKIKFYSPLPDSIRHSGYKFPYAIDRGDDYPVPEIAVDTSQHGYHTFTMELLPHEARFLIDGHVLRRFPDRLIPIGDNRYDYVTTTPRAPMGIYPEFDMTGSVGSSDYVAAKADFESKYGIGGTASQYFDYVKVWDLPRGSNMPGFPH